MLRIGTVAATLAGKKRQVLVAYMSFAVSCRREVACSPGSHGTKD